MTGILEGYKANFETLCRAIKDGNAVLLECFDHKTNKPVAVVCAVNYDASGGASFVPLATLFDENPYERLDPPEPGSGNG
ncbi:MAG: DUF6117 family protein [Methylococcaceae bacterium]|jgi:hypothetical protein|nr:DUF6117 family protein [Methylococcaceae bacterium]